MNDLTMALFIVNIAWLAVHELDAIENHEWRIFFARIPVSDRTAYRIFTALHVPLFALIIALAPLTAFQLAFDLFLIIHLGLHIAFRHHPAYEFSDTFSHVWIAGGAVLGGLHLLLLLL